MPSNEMRTVTEGNLAAFAGTPERLPYGSFGDPRTRSVSCDRKASLREGARLPVRFDEVGEVACGRAVGCGERLLDDVGDPEEGQSSVEERGDGDLVGCVERTRRGSATLAGRAREPQHRERLLVGGVELEREPRREVERRDRRRGAVRIR